ncbi:MAG: sarcosine oxidase [Gammaproteobacteria bacterium]|nr:MAG: sarcosine oxidase [Gammaproteobacteria bacterium]
MSETHPNHFLIRSPHYRTLLAEGANFIEHRDVVLVDDYGNSAEEEAIQAKRLGIVDLTSFARSGFKGKQAIQWAKTQGLNIGETNNQAYLQENGALVARLADTEVLILNNINSGRNQCTPFEEEYDNIHPAKCYTVPRNDSSAWFMITGEHASEMFAKICGIDLRLNKFSNHSIAQTSIARINGIIIRNDINQTPAFYLLFDSASTGYMWSCLKDAFVEFNGAPVGDSALSKL